MSGVDVLFVGPTWASCWGALKARHHGLKAAALAVADKRAPTGLVVYEGNGERKESSERVYGPELTRSLWKLSHANFAVARTLGQAAQAVWSDAGTVWQGAPDPEPGLVMKRSALEQFLASQVGEGAIRAGWDWRIRKNGSFDFQVGGLQTRIVCLVGDAFRPELFPFFSDKWIPCTLSSFVYTPRAVPPGSLFLFNGGADFALREGDKLRVGSFRNLYSDQGVGFHDEPDEVTRQNTEQFFLERGWISPPEWEARLQVGTVTCDGLPLIGALPEEPGVFVAGGFAGREANFLFAVLDKLTDALAGRGLDPGLEPYSTKRFT